MRCCACFADIDSSEDSLCCVVCKLQFHLKCTSWKHLDCQTVSRLRTDWHCIFCRKNQIKPVLFVVDDTSLGIRQQTTAKRTAMLSTRNLGRKLLNIKKSNYNSTYILDDMIRSLDQLKTSVGSLSAHNVQSAVDNGKIKKIIGDMSYKLENLSLI